MAILLDNALVVTLEGQKGFLEGQQLLIRDGAIAAIGKRVVPNNVRIQKRIDCSGQIVMPGLINAHSHLTEILQRSMRDNYRMENWRAYRALTEDMARLAPREIQAAAELACGEMLKRGVTAVVDHFSTRPGLSVEKMTAILNAFDRAGMRGMLAASLRDQDLIKLVASPRRRSAKVMVQEPWREEVLALLERRKRSSSISGLMLGPSSPQNCSDELLREVADLAERRDLGIHTHLLETRLQRWAAHKLYGKGLTEHLSEIGFLSSRLSAAHCVWLDRRGIEIMAAAGASAVHNPASNLKLGSGIAPVIQMKKSGVNVALGTDGGDTSDSYSIFDQMRLAAFLSRLTARNSDDWLTARDALRMATVNGANAIPSWRGRTGRIKKGHRADLVIIKPDLSLLPLNDIIHQLVFCEVGPSVDTVLIDGEIVVQAGRLTRLNETALREQVAPIGRKMAHFYRRVRNRSSTEAPLLRRLYARAFRDTNSDAFLN